MINDNDLKQDFIDASLEDYLDKKTICAGLEIKKNILDRRAIEGGGPPFIKESGRLMYKKIDAIRWMEKYVCESKSVNKKLRKAIFSMANTKK